MRGDIESKLLRVDIRAGDDDDERRANGLEERDQHVAAGDVDPLRAKVTGRRCRALAGGVRAAENNPRHRHRADGCEQRSCGRSRRLRHSSPRQDDGDQRNADQHVLHDRSGILANARRLPAREPPSSRRPQRHERHRQRHREQRRAELVKTGSQKPKRDRRQSCDDGGGGDRPRRRAAQQTSKRAPLAARAVRRDESDDRGFETDVAAEQQDGHPARRVDEVAIARGTQQRAP